MSHLLDFFWGGNSNSAVDSVVNLTNLTGGSAISTEGSAISAEEADISEDGFDILTAEEVEAAAIAEDGFEVPTAAEVEAAAAAYVAEELAFPEDGFEVPTAEEVEEAEAAYLAEDIAIPTEGLAITVNEGESEWMVVSTTVKVYSKNDLKATPYVIATHFEGMARTVFSITLWYWVAPNYNIGWNAGATLCSKFGARVGLRVGMLYNSWSATISNLVSSRVPSVRIRYGKDLIMPGMKN